MSSTSEDRCISLLIFGVSNTLLHFFVWRNAVIRNAIESAEKILFYGYCEINSPVSISDKCQAWNFLIKDLLKHWKVACPSFSLNKPSTFPNPEDGRCYKLSYKVDSLSYMPKLVTNSFEVQIVVCALLDPAITTFHFGSQTHWKLKLISFPFWLLFGNTFRPRRKTELYGNDQAWHIVNAPNYKFGEAGQPIPANLHVDDGECSIYTSGLPESSLDATMYASVSVEERLLMMIFMQLAVLFYCDTPGALGIEEGATGFLRQGHIALIHALRGILSSNPSGFRIGFDAHKKALAQVGTEQQMHIQQIELAEDKVLLSFGWLPHTTMFAKRLMEGNNIRVIQNCKLCVGREMARDPAELLQCVRSLPDNSLLLDFLRNPMKYATNRTRSRESDGIGDGVDCQRLLDLSSRYCELIAR